VEFALAHKVFGVLISPLLVGPAMVGDLVRKYPLAIMTHPAFSGTHFHDRRHGMTPAVLLGKMFRLMGSDISVFPNAGGRFGFTQMECNELVHALRETFSGFKPTLPAPAGGMTLERISTMANQYGPDTVYLIGGALLKYKDLTEGTREFMRAIRAEFNERLTDPVRN
jgi:ribulose-bisphosphate carboxylase large chain